MVAPYGTPLPYPALYPPGGLYAHPNMAVGAALTVTNAEVNETNGKDADAGFAKKSRGTLGKAASGSGNRAASQSDESASEGSSEASDQIADQQASSATKKRSFNQMLNGANGKINNAAQFIGDNPSPSVPGNPAMPTTNLNIGVDLWSAPVGTKPMSMNPNASPVQADSATMVVHEGILRDRHWSQDDRELKREKRKQSNRESARRSRMRKQAECEELQVKVDKLSKENRALRDEVHLLAEECEKITSENNSIMEELTNLYGPDGLSKFQDIYHKAALQSSKCRDNSNGL